MIRAALSAMAACVTAVAFYAVLRGIQFLLFRDANPALVIWSAHAGYFWRALIVSYAGGMAGFFAWLASERSREAVARLLARAVVVATALAFVQALFLP